MPHNGQCTNLTRMLYPPAYYLSLPSNTLVKARPVGVHHTMRCEVLQLGRKRPSAIWGSRYGSPRRPPLGCPHTLFTYTFAVAFTGICRVLLHSESSETSETVQKRRSSLRRHPAIFAGDDQNSAKTEKGSTFAGACPGYHSFAPCLRRSSTISA